jgi:hypothetical protein
MSDLLKINVNEHTEKKNGLTYLSWAWAWAKVLEVDHHATWEAFEFDGLPVRFLPDGSAMVKTAVTIKGHTKTCWLPVMNHRNQAIKNPDAFAINTAMVRCLTKTISMHGLGLYIYAGEDLPEGEVEEKPIRHSPTQGAQEEVTEEEMSVLRDLAMEIIAMCNDGQPGESVSKLKEQNLTNEQKTALWTLLPSNVRSMIKTAEKIPR